MSERRPVNKFGPSRLAGSTGPPSAVKPHDVACRGESESRTARYCVTGSGVLNGQIRLLPITAVPDCRHGQSHVGLVLIVWRQLTVAE